MKLESKMPERNSNEYQFVGGKLKSEFAEMPTLIACKNEGK